MAGVTMLSTSVFKGMQTAVFLRMVHLVLRMFRTFAFKQVRPFIVSLHLRFMR